ncbi:MAG: hypothetical protein Q8941_04290 [Bacteroidota bacterium]|nr:hypothetical protein [Bacteroidota bacterium]
MKRFYLLMQFLLMLLFALYQTRIQAQEAKVFSKYNYYTTEKEVIIIAEISHLPSPSEYILSVFNGNKRVAESGVIKNNLLNIKMPLNQFDPGKTELTYSISHKGVIIQKNAIDIVRLQPKANEVKIDLQTGGLIADGLPFFPVGFYCRPVERLPEQEITHGFTLIAPYQSNLPETYEERKAYMDRCARLGMRVQYSVNSLIGSGHNGAKGLAMSEEEKEEILKKEIIAFRDHPALLSWYINDEPDGQGRPPALLEKAYRIVHELDPYHPVSIVFMLPSKFSLYRNCMDIAMTDPYPVPGPLNMVEQFVNQMNLDFRHEKSIWLVPQAFGGQEMWAREPTAKEIRLMTYLGLINGVKAIQYYTHAAGNLNPQAVSAWSVCSDIAVEVNQMASFLLSDEIATPISANDSMVVAKSFSHDGDLLVIAVNKENKPKPVSIQINNQGNQQQGSLTASLWFENRELTFKNGKLNDIIDALGTRVYLIKGKTIQESTGVYPGNLTLNPGFEKIISPGLPIGSNTKKSFPGKEDAGASFFADPRQSVDGMFSLRLTTPVDSSGDKIRLLPIVIKAKNSYRVSIWAKAKEQEKMPSFRIGVEGPGQEKIFKLTKDWQQYSFIFQSDSSFSAAIINFDLLTAGTAWFDLVQVTPDPLISYSIGKDRVAKVSITSTVADAEIKYWIGDSTLINYTQPFLINKAATIQAGLFVHDKQVAMASSLIPVSKALGKPVTLQSQYAPQYAASGNSSLTDGMMGSTAFKDNKWLGFSGKDVLATIDLQKAETIHSVTVNFLLDPNSGIYLPPRVSVFVSENGKDFKWADTYTNHEVPRMGEPGLRSFIIGNKEIKARYIRVVAETFGDIPEGYLFKGTKSWIFMDEIMVE